jgi:hypothetical protein
MKEKLDPPKTLDVAKYAKMLGNPIRPYFVEGWLENLLNIKHPTFDDKVDAVTTTGVNTQFLSDCKDTIHHPEMNNYIQEVDVASRALKVSTSGTSSTSLSWRRFLWFARSLWGLVYVGLNVACSAACATLVRVGR